MADPTTADKPHVLGKTKGFMGEFKTFAMRGNVVDLAVGVVIGAAFGKIVTNLVEGLITPLVGLALGGVDLSDRAVVLKPAVMNGTEVVTPAVLLKWGLLIQSLMDFVIVAFAIFLLVKFINRLRRAEAEKPADPPAPTAEEKLLVEIRDLLAAQSRDSQVFPSNLDPRGQLGP